MQVKIFNEDNLDIETTVNFWLNEHKNYNIESINITSSKYPCRPIIMIVYEELADKPPVNKARGLECCNINNEIALLYDEVERGIISNV